ncbi:alpha/beta hydrolase-fold protein [Cryptosporangium japonicum]|uniref:Alpha/beta hydrolase-fold protein n=1 Tax=Cryptosporangium japonicum TaxID=80872 RepID=A0ABN0UWE9_9ACTN
MVSRRAVLGTGVAGLGLLAAGGVGLVGTGVVPGESRLRRALGACDVYAPDPKTEPGDVVGGQFRSAHRRATVRYQIAYPPGFAAGSSLPVCLVLHGYGGDERVLGAEIALPGYLADVVADGVPAFALAAVDGGPRYWHPRADGDDPLGMLTDEFLPLLAGRGLQTGAGRRIGLLGYSMGGYGALLFAELNAARVAACAVGGPAIWRSYADARRESASAFDSAADWSRYDVLAHGAALAGVPVRVDYGTHDPNAAVMPAVRAALPEARVRESPGCHDATFWRSTAPGALTFIGRTFAQVPLTG